MSGTDAPHVAYPWMGEVVDSAHARDGYVLVRWRTGSPMRLEAQERVECVVHLPVIRGGAAVDAARGALPHGGADSRQHPAHLRGGG